MTLDTLIKHVVHMCNENFNVHFISCFPACQEHERAFGIKLRNWPLVLHEISFVIDLLHAKDAVKSFKYKVFFIIFLGHSLIYSETEKFILWAMLKTTSKQILSNIVLWWCVYYGSRRLGLSEAQHSSAVFKHVLIIRLSGKIPMHCGFFSEVTEKIPFYVGTTAVFSTPKTVLKIFLKWEVFNWQNPVYYQILLNVAFNLSYIFDTEEISD